MSYGEERTYKKVDLIGVSNRSIEDAVQQAVTKAKASLDGLSWVEVQEIRGHIDADGKVSEYQVSMRVAFKLK